MKHNPYLLYLVTDEHQDEKTLVKVLEQAIKGGATMVQIREKHGNVRAFVRRAQLAKQILTGTGVPLIINDRLDVALAVDADGLHLGQSDMPVEISRKLLGSDKILGLTVENIPQLIKAQSQPLDYLGVSTVFPTTTKSDTKFVWGLAGLKQAVLQSALPLVAIGGINKTNISAVANTKVSGMAIVSAICLAEDPYQATSDLLNLITQN